MELPCYCGTRRLDPEHCTNVREGTPLCVECANKVDNLICLDYENNERALAAAPRLSD